MKNLGTIAGFFFVIALLGAAKSDLGETRIHDQSSSNLAVPPSRAVFPPETLVPEPQERGIFRPPE